MTTEQLLKEAILRYPIGTKYKSANPYSEYTYIVERQNFEIISSDMIWGESGKETLYRDGKWAEIIEYPEGYILPQEVVGYEIY